jgi:drug/metabolite transporter (DMT)-like permease
MCGIRFSVAGVFMLAFCGLRGRKIYYHPAQLGQMAVVGVLLLMGGNLTLSYAEKHVASGLAALIIAVTPLWFLVLDSLLLGDHHIAARGKVGLGLGIAGLLVLLWPDLARTNTLGRVQFWASISLLGASFSWALGSVLAKKWKSADVDPFSATAWQMVAAGGANSLLAIASGDPIASGLDRPRCRCRALPRSLRLVGWIYGIHLVAGSCAYVESFYLRLRQSGSGGFPGLADPR